MTELAFAKTFLAALDTKPSRISAEHVEDPKTYPARGAYILPKMPKPLSKRQKLAPGQERSITVTLKSLRNPPLDIKLTSQAPNTSVLDLKSLVSEQAGVPVDKLKLLHKKKPVGDSKVLKDLVGDDEVTAEFSIMVMGGAASVIKKAASEDTETSPSVPAAQGTSGAETANTQEFWGDLKGFLTQRLRDEEQAEKMFGTFKTAWEANESKA